MREMSRETGVLLVFLGDFQGEPPGALVCVDLIHT